MNGTQTAIKVAALAKLEVLTDDQLKKVVATLTQDFRVGADVALAFALEVLEDRMQQAAFVEFCNAI